MEAIRELPRADDPKRRGGARLDLSVTSGEERPQRLRGPRLVRRAQLRDASNSTKERYTMLAEWLRAAAPQLPASARRRACDRCRDRIETCRHAVLRRATQVCSSAPIRSATISGSRRAEAESRGVCEGVKGVESVSASHRGA